MPSICKLTVDSASVEMTPRKVDMVVSYRLTVRVVAPPVAVRTRERLGEKAPAASEPKKLPPKARRPPKLSNVMVSLLTVGASQTSPPWFPPARNSTPDRR
jgi:hypothetical protein